MSNSPMPISKCWNMPAAKWQRSVAAMLSMARHAFISCTAAVFITVGRRLDGWERKRGKLHELNLLLRGDKDTTYLQGANTVPENVQYVMTLDADTRLMRDAVTKLVGKLHHPINRPVHDVNSGRVIHGYGLLQPRVTPSLTTGKDASVFQRVYSMSRGIDLTSSPFPTFIRI